MNAREPHDGLGSIGLDYGWVPLGNKPLHELVLTKISDYMMSLGHIDFMMAMGLHRGLDKMAIFCRLHC